MNWHLSHLGSAVLFCVGVFCLLCVEDSLPSAQHAQSVASNHGAGDWAAGLAGAWPKQVHRRGPVNNDRIAQQIFGCCADSG